MMLRSNFYHIISSGPFHFLLGLSQPLIWFTCCHFHSQCNQRDKRNIILFFKSSHWLWNKISFHSMLYMALNIFLSLQPLALSLKTACLRFFCPYVNENHVFFLPSLQNGYCFCLEDHYSYPLVLLISWHSINDLLLSYSLRIFL